MIKIVIQRLGEGMTYSAQTRIFPYGRKTGTATANGTGQLISRKTKNQKEIKNENPSVSDR